MRKQTSRLQRTTSHSDKVSLTNQLDKVNMHNANGSLRRRQRDQLHNIVGETYPFLLISCCEQNKYSQRARKAKNFSATAQSSLNRVPQKGRTSQQPNMRAAKCTEGRALALSSQLLSSSISQVQQTGYMS
ncbi:uncharacterized protein LAESUDRAFT_158553 [Laetiporus sulphureus 93-53]|uniref:Uncharacterized protein n=1 Tax=Laetiporus sulphureus 93-53 TaxID=1314785 RepID=A0A165HM75_9APHY|nr:uncharacterized protein LAESUDRAFT_158553 [Laetiporus sulphureus 93-53]KZT11918.1 hypothetical protein LAESUDRAFT_158553 [Laetiporus sulphureus 93-53]